MALARWTTGISFGEGCFDLAFGINLESDRATKEYYNKITLHKHDDEIKKEWRTYYVKQEPLQEHHQKDQLDFAPYASRSYSAQWNVQELLHDMHMLHLSRILG